MAELSCMLAPGCCQFDNEHQNKWFTPHRTFQTCHVPEPLASSLVKVYCDLFKFSCAFTDCEEVHLRNTYQTLTIDFACLFLNKLVMNLSNPFLFFFTGNYQKALETYKDIHRKFPENVECNLSYLFDNFQQKSSTTANNLLIWWWRK